MKYGALNIFAAALLLMVSSAIHLHTPLFNLALVVKLVYLSFYAAWSIMFLIAPTSTRVWIAVRMVTALLLLGNDIAELASENRQDLTVVPEWHQTDSSSSEASSAGSEYSSDARNR